MAEMKTFFDPRLLPPVADVLALDGGTNKKYWRFRHTEDCLVREPNERNR